MNPLDDADAYDYIVLAGQRSPGLCEVTDAASVINWDVTKASGQSGATVKYTGDSLIEFTVTFFAWLTEHFVEWETFGRLTGKPAPGAEPEARDIVHPYLTDPDIDVHSVVVKGMTQWNQVEPGKFAKKGKFLQYRAPKAASGKPSGSKSSAGAGAGGSAGAGAEPAVKDEYDQMIEDMTRQVQELAA